MLVLSRKRGEMITIGNRVTVTVLSIQGDRVKLGIVAPPKSLFHRQKSHERIGGCTPCELRRVFRRISFLFRTRHKEIHYMSVCTHDNVHWMEPSAVTVSVATGGQKVRIMKALGLTGDRLPNVDEDTLFVFTSTSRLISPFPFAATIPSTNAKEQSDFCCYVMELL